MCQRFPVAELSPSSVQVSGALNRLHVTRHCQLQSHNNNPLWSTLLRSSSSLGLFIPLKPEPVKLQDYNRQTKMPDESAVRKLHVVLLTLGAQGHMNPFLNLAKKLARLGVSVTLLLPTKCFHKSVPDTEGLDIKIAALLTENGTSPVLLPPRLTVRGIRRHLEFNGSAMFPSPSASLKQVLQDMVQDSACVSPAAVIHDVLLYWATAPIDELGIPRYVLNTAATSHLAVGLYLFANPDKSGESVKQEAENQGVIRVPGLPAIRWEEIGMEHKVASDVFFLGEKNARETLLGSKGILVNSSHALEGGTITGLQAAHPNKLFLPVGPLVSHMQASKHRYHPCLSWLDKQASRSVVYVSFGSWAGLGVEQIRELALGLEMSNKSFLWLLPVCSGERTAEDGLDELLPDGFRERMHERGLVYPDWAPQQEILSHASVGGFITHCGWNSVTECLTLGGVPMLAWPFVADQPVTCRYLVEALRVAVDVHENSEGLADRNEVCRAVCALEDPKLRERAAWLKDKVKDGSDENKTLEEFVKRLKVHV